jgi:hypothetical protein
MFDIEQEVIEFMARLTYLPLRDSQRVHIEMQARIHLAELAGRLSHEAIHIGPAPGPQEHHQVHATAV